MPVHSSPHDRGSADRFYKRRFRPHKFINATRIEELTRAEVSEYTRGWDEETGEKDYG